MKRSPLSDQTARRHIKPSLADNHHAAFAKARKQLPHVFLLCGDTSRCWRELLVAEMKKDCAAAPAPDGRNIIIQHHHQIIEMILPPEQLVRLGAGQLHRAVIGAALCAITPAEARLNRLQFRIWARASVGAVKAAQQPETPGRRCAVSLALEPCDARAAQRTRHGAPGNDQMPFGGRIGLARDQKPPNSGFRAYQDRVASQIWTGAARRVWHLSL